MKKTLKVGKKGKIQSIEIVYIMCEILKNYNEIVKLGSTSKLSGKCVLELL